MNLTVHIQILREDKPPHSACGVSIFDEQSARFIHEAGYRLDDEISPHAPDWHALNRAITLALDAKPESVTFRCNAQRLVNQITGAQPVEDDALAPLYEQALGELLKLDSWSITAVKSGDHPRSAELAAAALTGGDVVELDRDQAAQRHATKHTGVPQWTVELLEEPGVDCPARCHSGIRYAFGPDTPAGFCVHAAGALFADSPTQWIDAAQYRLTTVCPHCDVPIRVVVVE